MLDWNYVNYKNVPVFNKNGGVLCANHACDVWYKLEKIYIVWTTKLNSQRCSPRLGSYYKVCTAYVEM